MCTVYTVPGLKLVILSSKAEEPGPDLVEVGGGQVNGEAAVRGVEHLHLPGDPRHGTEFLLLAGACVRPWS